ncbi:unnamed protein product [Cyprideis torosa]|uniref:Uncharacterized protein n=1 Tax=Cyprideis torosa TaxID=163714 RepID=A0A7R8W8J0_9CRUS|nr:unnamed protein product [Cyprideis torosa]CAG0883250.1 unnamed protein product [Cyprideis torosa]
MDETRCYHINSLDAENENSDRVCSCPRPEETCDDDTIRNSQNIGSGMLGSDSSITVHVHPTTGGHFELKTSAVETVDNLKKMISKKLKVPKDRICLLYREKHLRDGSLNNNFVVDGARIILLPSVEAGLLAQRPEQSVMQALESLSDTQSPVELVVASVKTQKRNLFCSDKQGLKNLPFVSFPFVKDFLSGKAPLNLTMRLGDHMMLIQLQLSTVTPGSRAGVTASSSSSATTSSTTTSTPSSCSAPSPPSPHSTCSFLSTPPSLIPHGPHPQPPPQHWGLQDPVHPHQRQAHPPVHPPPPGPTTTGRSVEELSSKACTTMAEVSTPARSLNPLLQDGKGRPRRDISTIIHILNDLLCATPGGHYGGGSTGSTGSPQNRSRSGSPTATTFSSSTTSSSSSTTTEAPKDNVTGSTDAKETPTIPCQEDAVKMETGEQEADESRLEGESDSRSNMNPERQAVNTKEMKIPFLSEFTGKTKRRERRLNDCA